MLKVHAQNPELQRRGQILAVVILGIALSAATLSGINLLNGQYEYNVPNAIFLFSVLGLFVLNRLGYVAAACMLTVTLIVAASAVFLSGEDLAQTFIICESHSLYPVSCLCLGAALLPAQWSSSTP